MTCLWCDKPTNNPPNMQLLGTMEYSWVALCDNCIKGNICFDKYMERKHGKKEKSLRRCKRRV
jgi:hypothetical protein